MTTPMRIMILAALLLAAGASVRAELPPYGDWHPRLLVDDALLSTLPDSIAADTSKADAWALILQLGEQFKNAPPGAVLDVNWGLTNLPAMSMVGLLADEPLAGECRAKVRETALHVASTESVLGSGDDLDSILRLHAMLVSYDMAFAEADETERETLLAEIREYLETMTTDWLFVRGVYNPFCSNHSIVLGAAMGMADLALAGEWPDDPLLDTARSLGDSLIDKALDDLLGADGSYGEGGLYLAYIHRLLVPYWEAALRLEGLTLWDDAKLSAAFEWTAYQLLPRGEAYVLNRNDCSESTRPLSRHSTLWEWGQHRLTDPRFPRWVQEHITGPSGHDQNLVSDQVSVLLHHRAGEVVAPDSFLPRQAYFPDQGLYVYRNSWPPAPLSDSFHFSFQAGTFYGGHWQEDVGQVTLRAFGHSFAMDHGPGVTARQTEAHNLPLIADLGQHNAGDGIGTDGEMQALLVHGFVHALKADMEPAYSGHSPFNDPDYPVDGMDWSWGYDGGNPMERADRWLLLFPPHLPDDIPDLYLLDDLRKDGQAHTMEWRLHFAEDLSLSVEGDRYRIGGSEGRLDARLLSPPVEETSWDLSSYDNGNPDDDSQVLAIHHTAVEARWFWRWLPRYVSQVEPPLSIERHDDGLLALHGGAPYPTREILCAWEDSIVTGQALLVGRFAIHEEIGADSRYALIAGRESWREGQLRFRLEPAGSASVAGDTVMISDPELIFQIYAPEAQVVLAGEQPVSFVRDGDYIYDSSRTAAPWNPGASGAWTLGLRDPRPGRLPIQILARGPGALRARLEVFDVRGRRVARLHEGPWPGGERVIPWRGRDDAGRPLAAGIYLARLAADGQSASTKLILLH